MNEPLEPNDVYDSTETTLLDRARILGSNLRTRTHDLRVKLDESTQGVREAAGEKVSRVARPGGSVDKVEDFLTVRLEELRTKVGTKADKAVDVAVKGVTTGADLTRKGAEFVTKRR